MNRVEIIGRLVRDVETTQLKGYLLSKFTIAVDRRYKDENGDKITDFFNCNAWRGLAENIDKYCHKGSKVYISGELHNRCWENEKGIKQYFTEILVNECEFLDSKQKADMPEGLTPIDDDSLPF